MSLCLWSINFKHIFHVSNCNVSWVGTKLNSFWTQTEREREKKLVKLRDDSFRIWFDLFYTVRVNCAHSQWLPFAGLLLISSIYSICRLVHIGFLCPINKSRSQLCNDVGNAYILMQNHELILGVCAYVYTNLYPYRFAWSCVYGMRCQ